MKLALLPQALRDEIAATFGHAEMPAFGQLATVGPDGPEVRTVHFRFEGPLGTLVFNSHSRSRKMRGLGPGSVASGCYFDAGSGCEWLWCFSTSLLSFTSPTPSADFKTVDLGSVRDGQWRQMRLDVRIAYWLDHKGLPLGNPLPTDIDVNVTCPTFVTAICISNAWQRYRFNEHNYTEGTRARYVRHGDAWTKQDLLLLYTD